MLSGITITKQYLLLGVGWRRSGAQANTARPTILGKLDGFLDAVLGLLIKSHPIILQSKSLKGKNNGVLWLCTIEGRRGSGIGILRGRT